MVRTTLYGLRIYSRVETPLILISSKYTIHLILGYFKKTISMIISRLNAVPHVQSGIER